MATLTIRTEANGVVRPQFDHVREHQRGALQTEPDAITPRARQINERAMNVYTLSWHDANEGQRRGLLSIWGEARANILPMNFTPIGLHDASALEVQFVEDSLTIRRSGPGKYEMAVDIERVR